MKNNFQFCTPFCIFALVAILAGCASIPLQQNLHPRDGESQYQLALRYEEGDGVPQNNEHAGYWYTQAAEADVASAQYRLAIFYDNGIVVLRNANTAAKWYTRAAKHGIAEAQLSLAMMYDKGRGVPQSDAKALLWYERAAEQGLTVAQHQLAEKLAKTDLPKAISWYERIIAEDEAKVNIEAYFALAQIYESDDVQNHERALQLYIANAERGHVSSQLHLAEKYEQGINIKQNIDEALRWYRQAAESQIAEAKYRIGLIYAQGRGGIPADKVQAAKWYAQAAEQGYAAAQNDLGVLYYAGDGVPKNLQRAADLYKRAAEQHYARAQYNLGVLSYLGIGTKQNFAAASYWQCKAAMQDDVTAQYNIGVFYWRGEGVRKNQNRAYLWLWLAAQNGETRAKQLLQDPFWKTALTASQQTDIQQQARQLRTQIKTPTQQFDNSNFCPSAPN